MDSTSVVRGGIGTVEPAKYAMFARELVTSIIGSVTAKGGTPRVLLH
jgi:hypothetical protein